MSYDINFGTGDNHVLIIDTRSYSGNFERELAAYVIGAGEEDQHHGRHEMASFDEDAEELPVLKDMQAKVTTQSHREYGDVYQTIWETPGRLNDGAGRHYDEKDGRTGWPAYESVAIFLDEPLTDDEMKIAEQRARDFLASQKNYEGKATPIKFKDIRQITVTVERTERVTTRKR